MFVRKYVVPVGFLASLLFAGTGAYAADLGGDCCADLEERIAELEATTARKGNRKVSLNVYGEVNEAVLFWDDGTESNAYVVTNATTKNLLGFEGSASIDPNLSAGYRIELELLSAPSDSVDQGDIPDDNEQDGVWSGFGTVGARSGIFLRHANWWIEHKKLGRLTVGKGSNSTDGIAEHDLSGSTAVSVSAIETWNESFLLRDKRTGEHVIAATGFSGTGIVVDVFVGNMDGGRGNLVRYDSPVIGGFILSAAWGEDDDWDVALRYGGEFAGFRVLAGIGYHDGQINDTDNFIAFVPHQEWVGSASVLHVPTGLFVTVAGGTQEWANEPIPGLGISIPRNDLSYVYGKTGVFQKWNSLGKTSVYGEYYHAWDVGIRPGSSDQVPFDPTDVCSANCTENSSVWGVGVVQHIDAAAMEVYLAYRHYWADNLTDLRPDPNTDHDFEFDAVMSGARIKF